VCPNAGDIAKMGASGALGTGQQAGPLDAPLWSGWFVKRVIAELRDLRHRASGTHLNRLANWLYRDLQLQCSCWLLVCCCLLYRSIVVLDLALSVPI